MNDKLISKKELLEETGISYGQLYRWKRERLIPEEWFIKQASYTGQETFLPKKKALQRINRILELKESRSLEELAALFSPEMDLQLPVAGLESCCSSNFVLSGKLERTLGVSELSLPAATFIFGLSQLKEQPPAAQITELIRSTLPLLDRLQPQNRICLLLSADNRSLFSCFCRDSEVPLFDPRLSIRARFSMDECAVQLRQTLDRHTGSGLSSMLYLPLFGI